MSGPPPTPSNVHALRGNPGHRPINDQAPEPELVNPDPPGHLTDAEAAKWREVAPKLHAVGCLTEVDVDDLERYCKAWVRYQEADVMVRLLGQVVVGSHKGMVINPWLNILDRTSNELQRFSDRFAFNPAYRTKVKAVAPKKRGNKFER